METLARFLNQSLQQQKDRHIRLLGHDGSVNFQLSMLDSSLQDFKYLKRFLFSFFLNTNQSKFVIKYAQGLGLEL